jgi:hypothetical protein
MKIDLRSVAIPDFGIPEALPAIPEATYARRCADAYPTPVAGLPGLDVRPAQSLSLNTPLCLPPFWLAADRLLAPA